MFRIRMLTISVLLASGVLVVVVSLTLAQPSSESVPHTPTLVAGEPQTSTGMAQPSSVQTPTPDLCPDHVNLLSDLERTSCVERVGGWTEVKMTMDAHMEETTRAKPTIEPGSGLKTEVALVKSWGTPTPTPTFLPNGLPGWYDQIRELQPEDRYLSRFSYKYYVSVWHVGGLVTAEQFPYMLNVMTPQDRCAIETTTVSPYTNEHPAAYERTWPCPRDLGEITITGATGPTGIMSFTNEANQTGTFNLATETWSFEERIFQAVRNDMTRSIWQRKRGRLSR